MTIFSTQDQLAAGVVVDLAGHGVEVEPGLVALDLAQFQGQEVEEEGAVHLRGQGDELEDSLRAQTGLLDVLQGLRVELLRYVRFVLDVLRVRRDEPEKLGEVLHIVKQEGGELGHHAHLFQTDLLLS